MLCLGLLLCIAAYLLASSKLHDQLPEAARVPLVLMATVAPALFWLFAQVLFNDAFRWRFYVWLPLLALSVLSLLMEAGGSEIRISDFGAALHTARPKARIFTASLHLFRYNKRVGGRRL